MSDQTVYRVMKMLGAAYGKDQIEPETTELYVRMLSDIDDEVLEQSCIDHISKSQWFPKISELRKCAFGLSPIVRNIPSAYQAWQEVQGSFAWSWAHNDSQPDWSHPLILQTVKALGWMNLRMSTNSVADRARFIEAYGDFRERAIDDAITLPEIKQLAANMTKRIEGKV